MAQTQKKFIAANAVDGTKIRLSNDESLRARNQANSADVQLIKLDTSDNAIAQGAANAWRLAATPDGLVAEAISNVSYVGSAISAAVADYIPLTQKAAANGVATLDANSKIPSAQLPAIAITDVFVVADITARDALTIGSGDGEVQKGDVAVVTDASADPGVDAGGASYIYTGSAWQRLLTPTDAVLSVNGATGVVVLSASDLTFTQAVTGNWTVADGSTIKATLDEVGARLTQNESDISTNATSISDHIADATAAHAASAISNSPSGNLAATDVQSALDELQSDIDTRALASDLTNHLNDATDAHDASAISYVNTTSGLTATDAQAAIDEIEGRIDTLEAVSTPVAKEEIITLDGTDITNQYVDLAVAAANSESISLTPVGGIMQEKSVDYTISLTGGAGGVTRITFAGDLATSGAAELVATDKLCIRYEA